MTICKTPAGGFCLAKYSRRRSIYSLADHKQKPRPSRSWNGVPSHGAPCGARTHDPRIKRLTAPSFVHGSVADQESSSSLPQQLGRRVHIEGMRPMSIYHHANSLLDQGKTMKARNYYRKVVEIEPGRENDPQARSYAMTDYTAIMVLASIAFSVANGPLFWIRNCVPWEMADRSSK